MEITNPFAEYIGRQLNKEKEMTTKSKNKFAAGDKVVRVEPYTWNDDDGFMQVGREYLVVDASEKVLILKGDFNNIQYDPNMFKLVKPKFSNTKGMFANMKFRVNSPEHSKEIQEALFEMGYKWRISGTSVQWIHADHLTTCDDGELCYGNFDEASDPQEYTLEVTKSYKLIPVEIPKLETITIDGKTYDKEAVLKRLAELEGIE